MVISYFGALNAYLEIFYNLPNPVGQLIVLALMLLAAIKIIVRISGL